MVYFFWGLFLFFILFLFGDVFFNLYFNFLDFIVVFGVSAYLFHNNISYKIASGFAIYFWDFVFAFIILSIYRNIIYFIAITFPKIYKFLIFLIALASSYFLVEYSFRIITMSDTHYMLLNNKIADKIAYIILYIIVAKYIYRQRRYGK